MLFFLFVKMSVFGVVLFEKYDGGLQFEEVECSEIERMGELFVYLNEKVIFCKVGIEYI